MNCNYYSVKHFNLLKDAIHSLHKCKSTKTILKPYFKVCITILKPHCTALQKWYNSPFNSHLTLSQLHCHKCSIISILHVSCVENHSAQDNSKFAQLLE